MESCFYLFHLRSQACPNAGNCAPGCGLVYVDGDFSTADSGGWFNEPWFTGTPGTMETSEDARNCTLGCAPVYVDGDLSMNVLRAYVVTAPLICALVCFLSQFMSTAGVIDYGMSEVSLVLGSVCSQIMSSAGGNEFGSSSSIFSLILGYACTFFVGWVTLLICKSVSKWTLIVSLRLLKYALRFLGSALRLAWATLFTLRCQLFYAIFHASCQCNHSSLGLIVLFSVARNPLLYLFLRPVCFFGSTVFLTLRVAYLSLELVNTLVVL